jgi:thiol-disulfide isomerase/thioredoxin
MVPSTEKKQQESSFNKNKAPHVQEVLTQAQFEGIIRHEQDQITAVRFYAPWCRACKAAKGLYDGLVRTSPDVKFMEVPMMAGNNQLFSSMGINKFPTGQIYHPVYGLVEQLPISGKKVKSFDQILQSYAAGSCDLPEDVNPDSGVFEAPYERFQ